MEITDDMIKRKHQEFNARVLAALNKKGGMSFSPEIQRLRHLYQLRRPSLERPIGG